MVGVAFLLFGIATSFFFLILLICIEYLFNKNNWKYIGLTISILVFCFLAFHKVGSAIIKAILVTINPFNTKALMPQYWYLLGFSILFALFMLFLLKLKIKETIFSEIPGWIKNSITFTCILILIIVLGKQLFGNPHKYNAQIEYFAYKKEWDNVLKLKNKVAIKDRISLFHLNRALYHTGQMSNKLFTIRQHWGVNTLFLTIEFNRTCTINSSDLFYDMGFIKGAKYWALEAQTYKPYSPRILERLVSASVLLKDTLTVNKYLSVLSHSVITRKWAHNLKEKMTCIGIDSIRKEWFGNRILEQDIYYIDNKNPNRDLIQILKKDPGNKMAFEYLMSYYLLSSELGNFHKFLQKYGNYYYKTVPELYQQALIMYQLSMNVTEEQMGYHISNAVLNEMSQFNKILIEYKLDVRKAQKDLYKNFGDSYWYFLRYNSPRTLGTTIKKEEI
jgi:hypothetical protein